MQRALRSEDGFSGSTTDKTVASAVHDLAHRSDSDEMETDVGKTALRPLPRRCCEVPAIRTSSTLMKVNGDRTGFQMAYATLQWRFPAESHADYVKSRLDESFGSRLLQQMLSQSWLRPLSALLKCGCCVQPKGFDTIDQLRIHEAEKPLRCSYCNGKFKNRTQTKRHERTTHIRHESWSCPPFHRRTPAGIAETNSLGQGLQVKSKSYMVALPRGLYQNGTGRKEFAT
ncbi:hypothetical protein Purlil1_12528 [Purpureocillium lilacinum]|uniref:C2H2-type domain-containing protein n=1 Tax=Purpureocillium lilacinum TaxID=33203 RepID=A0ABR0BGQ4_PURLI|nr:hypothetical protein Purlil1_12528 [Purpureocillium lilacinum]